MRDMNFVRAGLVLALAGGFSLTVAKAQEGCVEGPFGDPDEPGPVVTELCAFTDGENLLLEWTFTEPVDPYGGTGSNPTLIAAEFDVDPTTGEPGGVELGYCGIDPTNFSTDAGLIPPDDPDAEVTSARLLSHDQDGNVVELGETDLIFDGNTITTEFEAAIIGSDDGILNLVSVVVNEEGSQANADPVCVPESGFLTSARAGDPRIDDAVSIPVAGLPGLVILMLAIGGLAAWRIRI